MQRPICKLVSWWHSAAKLTIRSLLKTQWYVRTRLQYCTLRSVCCTTMFARRGYQLQLGVCLSITSWCSIETVGWIELVLEHRGFLLPILHGIVMKFRCLQKSGQLYLDSNFVLNSGLRKFRHGISIVETCWQLSSTKVGAQSVINWTVVGQQSWQYLRQSTATLSHWSSTSVYSTMPSRGMCDSWYLFSAAVTFFVSSI